MKLSIVLVLILSMVVPAIAQKAPPNTLPKCTMALTQNANGPWTVAANGEPCQITSTPVKPKPFYKKHWFWYTVVTVAAVAVTGTLAHSDATKIPTDVDVVPPPRHDED